MNPTNRRSLVLSTAFLLLSLPAWGGWEVGARGAADSNVTRSVDGGTSDTYLYGYLNYNRDVRGERRLDWTLAATLDGALYNKVTGLSYTSVSLAPGLWYSPHAGWTITLGPFFQGKVANDSDQTALAWGARLGLQQQLGTSSYLGEYYAFTDSNARADVFSYREHALGAYLGHDWASSLWSEVGYRFSHGDAYAAVGSSASSTGTAARGMAGGGMGPGVMGGRSRGQLFGQDVFKETVDGHELSATLGYSLTKALTAYVGYTYMTSRGDLGTTRAHAGFLGIGYRLP